MKSLPLKNELFPLGYVTGNGQIIMSYIVMYNLVFNIIQRISAGFTYRLDRLKPRASKFRGPPVNVYNILTLLLDFHI